MTTTPRARSLLPSVECVEALGEPAVNRRKKVAGLIPLALVAPRPRHVCCCAQLPGFCLLLPRYGESALEMRFRSCCTRFARQQRDFSGSSVDLGFVPSFLGCLRHRHRFTTAAPSVIELVELCIGLRQT